MLWLLPFLGETRALCLTGTANFRVTFQIRIIIAAMAIMSSYYWSGFPFDNLCVDQTASLPDNYVGEFIVEALERENRKYSHYDLFQQ